MSLLHIKKGQLNYFTRGRWFTPKIYEWLQRLHVNAQRSLVRQRRGSRGKVADPEAGPDRRIMQFYVSLSTRKGRIN